MGITDPVLYVELGASRIERIGRRFQVVLHPALAGLDIGWSALMVDVLPITDGHLETMISDARGEDARGRAALEALREWLECPVSTWKVTDAPLEISSDSSDELRVARKNDDAAADIYLDAVGFYEDEVLEEFVVDSYGPTFRTALPVVLECCEDYRQLNRFAATLSVLRWTATHGVRVEGLTSSESRARSIPPGSIVITDDEIAPATAFQADEYEEALRKEARQRLDEVLAQIETLEAELSNLAEALRAAAVELLDARRTANSAVAAMTDDGDGTALIAAFALAQVEETQSAFRRAMDEHLIELALGNVELHEIVNALRTANIEADRQEEIYLEAEVDSEEELQAEQATQLHRAEAEQHRAKLEGQVRSARPDETLWQATQLLDLINYELILQQVL